MDLHDFKLEVENTSIKEKFDTILLMLNMLGYGYKMSNIETYKKNNISSRSFALETNLNEVYYFDFVFELLEKDDCFYLSGDISLYLFSGAIIKSNSLTSEYCYDKGELGEALDFILSLL